MTAWILEHLIGPWGAALGLVLAGAISLRARRTFRQWRAFLEKVRSMMATVEAIRAELAPNGGHTLADRVAAIQQQVRQIDTRTRRTDALQCVLIETMPESERRFETDAQGHWRTVSQGVEILTGYDSRELVGTGWVNLIPMDNREYVMREWLHAVRGKRTARIDFTLVRRDGQGEHVRLIATPMIDDAVDPAVIVGWFGQIGLRP